jgi:type I restriction enzyme, R subunit
LAGRAALLFKAILPDPAANSIAPLAVVVSYLAAKIRALTPAADISEVADDVEQLLNDSISTESYHIGSAPRPDPLIDLSKIDFTKLRNKFAKGEKRVEAEKLKGQIDQKLKRMVQINHSRVDFLERFEKLIAEYNASSHNLEAFFNELLRFAQSLNSEEQRAMREGLDEESLAIFDILTKPIPILSDDETKDVKKVAKELLAKLKAEKLVLDWREKMQSRADVQRTIRVGLRPLPPVYSPELKRTKANLTYAHVYDSYFGAGSSLYQPAVNAAPGV